jgi:hypothetical protein
VHVRRAEIKHFLKTKGLLLTCGHHNRFTCFVCCVSEIMTSPVLCVA